MSWSSFAGEKNVFILKRNVPRTSNDAIRDPDIISSAS